jgi:hypothetical protein
MAVIERAFDFAQAPVPVVERAFDFAQAPVPVVERSRNHSYTNDLEV